MTSTRIRWIARKKEDGVVVGRVGRKGDEYVAEWIGLARLTVRADGSDVRFEPAPSASPSDVEKIRTGAMELLLRQLRGEIGLHGASASVDGRAVILVGAAGAGKSTLAAGLCTFAKADFLADDAVAIANAAAGSGYEVVALETHHWLDGHSRRVLGLDASGEEDGPSCPKTPLLGVRREVTSASLRALVHLVFSDTDEPNLTRLSGMDAMAAVLPQIVRFVVDEPERSRVELDRIAKLIETIPVFRMRRARRIEDLPATVRRVADLLRSE